MEKQSFKFSRVLHTNIFMRDHFLDCSQVLLCSLPHIYINLVDDEIFGCTFSSSAVNFWCGKYLNFPFFLDMLKLWNSPPTLLSTFQAKLPRSKVLNWVFQSHQLISRITRWHTWSHGHIFLHNNYHIPNIIWQIRSLSKTAFSRCDWNV